jgi:hypothetical protein
MIKKNIKKRFVRNVKHNINRGNSEVWKNPDYQYPTPYQMNQFKKHHIVYDIDPALRNVIIDLNSKGYRTGGSCQGHIKENKHGYIKINTSKNQLPLKFRNNNTPLAKDLSTDLSTDLSLKNIDPNEIKSILKKHNIIITSYKNPYYPKDEINGRFSNQYVFFFSIILDKYPRESYSYFYIKNGNLETSYIPKNKNYVKLVQLRDLNGNYTGFKLLKNGKLIWKKDLIVKKRSTTLSIIKEMQDIAYNSLIER